MGNTAAPARAADLPGRLSACATSRGGTVRVADAHTVEGTLTAITANWFLGGRKVTNTFRCILDPVAQALHFRETAVDSSWGLPPPTFTVETSRQYGSRKNQSRTDTSAGGGGRLEFGRFREDVEKVASESGWTFVHEVA